MECNLRAMVLNSDAVCMCMCVIGRSQMFDGKTYQRTTLLVAFGYPGFVFGIVFLLNLFVWADGSSNAIPFGSMATVLVLWFLVSVPLVFLGAYFGFKKEKIAFPVRVVCQRGRVLFCWPCFVVHCVVFGDAPCDGCDGDCGNGVV